MNAQFWQNKIDNANSLTELQIVAEDMMVFLGANEDVWQPKIDNATSITQIEIVCDDLLVLCDE